MKLLRYVGFILLLALALPLSWNALGYINFDFTYGFLKLKQQAISTGWYLPGYYSHVLISGIILVAGIFQLHDGWRRQWPRIHKNLGKVYVFGILLFAAPGGFVMSFFIERGTLVFMSFVLQCLAWVVCTYLALSAIRNRDIINHRNWMWRSYSITLAAITLRVYVFLSSWSFDLGQPIAYATIAWLSWVPNLLVCEAYIFLKSRVGIKTNLGS
jgi:uncharacterized membrane protein